MSRSCKPQASIYGFKCAMALYRERDIAKAARWKQYAQQLAARNPKQAAQICQAYRRAYIKEAATYRKRRALPS